MHVHKDDVLKTKQPKQILVQHTHERILQYEFTEMLLALLSILLVMMLMMIVVIGPAAQCVEDVRQTVVARLDALNDFVVMTFARHQRRFGRTFSIRPAVWNT